MALALEVISPQLEEDEEKKPSYIDIMQRFDMGTYPAKEVNDIIEKFRQTIWSINLLNDYNDMDKEMQYRIARVAELSDEELKYMSKFAKEFHAINNDLQFVQGVKDFNKDINN